MYSQPPTHEKVEVSLMQILSAAVIVMVALVLPAQQLYTEQQTQEATTIATIPTDTNQFTGEGTVNSGNIDTTDATQNNGRVAGASTSARLIRIPILNITLDLSNQSQILYLAGGGLIIFSILMFFLASEPKRQEMKLPPHWR